VPALRYLNALALKLIFDRKNISAEEERRLDEGIQAWVRKVDLNAYEKRELQAIVKALLEDKEGRFDKEKFAYARANIDYRRVYSEGI
jgi:hypothetical protein